MTNTADNKRRPLKTRDAKWAGGLARWLTRTGCTPNQISVASMFFAALSAACFILAPDFFGTKKILLFIGAAAGIQLRLLCNMLDGMVAIEGGLKTKTGELYNEFPDRFADVLILVGAGYASRWLEFSPELGWAAAVMAVITAYNRALGVVAGSSQQFCGPMAKPHRMALMTAAALLTIPETLLHWPTRIIPIALMLVIVGCFVTIARRTKRIVHELNSK